MTSEALDVGGDSPRFDVLARGKLRDQAGRQLRAQIIAGRLKPGELYSVNTIAKQLQVSATPVREAVLDLAKDDLVEMVRNRGFLVKVPSDEDLDELVELRRVLEVPAMGRLATLRPRPDLTELRPLALQLERHAVEGDMVSFVALDREFHLGLTSLLGNRRYVNLVGLLRDQTRLLGLTQAAGTAALVDSAREHGQLLDAIAAGDRDAAERVMTRHLRHARGLWAGRPETQASAASVT